ncbi:hypothetical protein FRC20_008681 [Serendipita sp. 405]|nr:hypothetical protein FRC15_008949 [Serendipita sp. 397]KAG8797721.1 hypothetical protein FRC16_008586 [Serendipita sp. 398]KAG8866379.1 hypothetical protein FRC20_008681 [Serendipita sp. 405]
MPSSIQYSSMPPKFLDKQRRPGIIHLPQPLATPPRPTTKLPALNPSQKPSQSSQSNGNDSEKVNAQLRTPSPSPGPRQRQQQTRRKQKRSISGNILMNIVDISNGDVSAAVPNNDAVVETTGSRAVVAPRGVPLLSPPPTPASRASAKASKNKSKGRATAGNGHARRPSKTAVPLVTPPLTPQNAQFKPVTVEEAVFSLDSLLSAVPSAQDSSTDSLPLADDDEVIVWKQPQTPVSLYPTPPQRAFSTPSRTPSPTEFFNWEDVKNLPRLSPATIAQLKEQYDIRPSEAFLQQKSTQSQEPDLLMSLLHSSPSCPPSPGTSSAAPIAFSSVSKPIAISRRPNGSHVRAPSVPTYPSSGHFTMMQYQEDVADLFGLDARDVMAVQRATEAWRAYAGSAFNNSPETERVPAPKFLGRLFG